MDERLLNYREDAPLIYLDGRYFNAIFKNNKQVPTKPLIIKIRTNIDGSINETINNAVESNSDQIYINPTQNFVLLRVIIIIMSGDITISRHSNLLIFDNIYKSIMRFEPLIYNIYTNIINQKLENDFKYVLPQHKFEELNIHPQPIENIGLCVAYVINFAYFYSMGYQPTFIGEGDIVRFSLYVEQLYKNKLIGEQDIEFGLAGAVIVGSGIARRSNRRSDRRQ